VIPTLLLLGLVVGRWWKLVIPLGAVGWAVLLIVTGVDSGATFAVGAAAVAAVNLAVGALVFQAMWFLAVALPRSRHQAS